MLDALAGLFDKEKMVADTIKDALIGFSEELKKSHSDFFIMFQPVNNKFEFKIWLYQIENGVPKPVREVPIKEILDS